MLAICNISIIELKIEKHMVYRVLLWTYDAMGSSSSIVFSEMRGLRKGTWSKEEDQLLRRCIEKFGEGKWSQVPLKAGLNRCGKSCRLRWLDYLQPNIKRGDFEPDELDLIIRMHKLLGNRWSLIAGRLPGRTANDIKNYYNTHLKKNSFFKYDTDQEEQVVVIEKLDNNINDHCPRFKNVNADFFWTSIT